MSNKITQELIDETLALAKETDNELEDKLQEIFSIYKDEMSENERNAKQNAYFLKQWDKRKIKEQKESALQKEMLQKQSRLASMGEMIDAIAHQWKQPLNSISMMSDMLKDDFKNELVDEEYIDELDETLHMQIDHMVNTLGEFRNFFRPSTKNEYFYLQDVLDSVEILLKDELLSQNINLNVNIQNNLKLHGNKNEFKHLFINLINNSIDAFNEKNIQERTIFIRAYIENKKTYIEIEDNAGGVAQSVIDDIFKPNVTTKQDSKGTGIGLYMSEQIVSKNHATINVHNSEIGAFFTVCLAPLSI